MHEQCNLNLPVFYNLEKEQPNYKQIPLPADPLPADLQAKSKAKFQELQKKFPHMKPARIVKKVAQFYKIKLT